MDMGAFSKDELKEIRKLNTPEKLQAFVDSLTYNGGKRISIADVLRKRKGDCLESASFAYLVLKFHRIPCFLMDLSTVRDEDHVLCVFKKNKLYGAIAQSKFINLRYRTPVYKNLRELAMSYFEHYFNYFGEPTLRQRGIPVHLTQKDLKRIEDPKLMIELEDRLNEINHIQLVKEQRFPSVSKEKFKREILIFPKKGRVGKAYKR